MSRARTGRSARCATSRSFAARKTQRGLPHGRAAPTALQSPGPAQGASATKEDLTRLDVPPEPGRRDFVAAAVAAGFALAAQPISADTIITDTRGLDAGMVKVPVGTTKIEKPIARSSSIRCSRVGGVFRYSIISGSLADSAGSWPRVLREVPQAWVVVDRDHHGSKVSGP